MISLDGPGGPNIIQNIILKERSRRIIVTSRRCDDGSEMSEWCKQETTSQGI